MGLRAKLAAIFLGLLALAIISLSVAYLDWNLKSMARGLIESADRVSKEIFEQVRVALSVRGLEPAEALRTDLALNSAIRSALAFEDYPVYIQIVAIDGTVLAGSDGENPAPGTDRPPPIMNLEELADARVPVRLLAALWNEQTYELTRPVNINGVPFALINVGVSTGLIAQRVHTFVGALVAIALCAIVTAAVVTLVIGNIMLRPVLAITSGVEQLTAGNADVSLEIGGRDELSVLAEKFNQLSRRLRSDRNRWENERGNVVGSFRAIVDAVMLVDADGTLLFANNEAQERLGFAGNGLNEGKTLHLLLGQSHPLMQLVGPALMAGTEVRAVAFRLNGRHGDRTYLVSIYSLGQGDGPAGLLILMRDLQQVRDLEAMIDQSSRLARLGGLLSGVAHQIRKPLNVMTLQLELLRQDAETGKPARPRIERIRQEIRRLDSTIDALMRFMKPEKLRTERLDLNQLLSEIAAQIGQPNVHVRLQLAPELPLIHADRDLLNEALKNIAHNGAEAMTEGGELTIRTTASEGYVTVTISDQGSGIPPEDLQQIFNLYFTTKQNGNGLGLSLAARAIDVHGGSIDVASEVGVGSTFTIHLPIREESDAASEVQG